MNSIYKTQFGFHIDLSKILLISDLYFEKERYYVFNIKFELSDTDRIVGIEADRKTKEWDCGGGDCGYLTADGRKITNVRTLYYNDEEMKQTLFYSRAKKLHEEFVNTWKQFKDEH